MKKLLTLIVGTVLTIFFAGGTDSASAKEVSIDPDQESFKMEVLKSVQEEYPNAQFIETRN